MTITFGLHGTEMDLFRTTPPEMIEQDQIAEIAWANQRTAWLPRKIEIEGGDGWLILDILIGGKSQFAQPCGPIPGDCFAPDMVDSLVTFAPCLTAQDFRIRVQRFAAEPKIFDAKIFGVTVH